MTINITNLETTLNAKIVNATTSTPGQDLLLISKSVEALDNAIGLKAADIGTTVQAYDSTIVVDADIGVNVQAYDSTILVDADIGVNVQAYDADTTKNDISNTFTGANTFTANQIFSETTETVYDLVGLDIDPANGGKQHKTLTAPPTFTSSITNGQSVRLRIVGGDTHAVTWPAATWVTSAGNALPTATADDVFVIEMEGSTLYIYYLGSAV
jgi:hypothetical protein